MSTQPPFIIFLRCILTFLNRYVCILYIAHDPSDIKRIIISFCPTYLLRPLTLCIFVYFPSISRITFHCLSFVPLTVIHLPGRVDWISWSVMKISWLLFLHSGRFSPDEKKTAPFVQIR